MKKVVLITGASRGIGKEIALLLASKGARIIVNYAHSDKDANDVVNTIFNNGGNAIAIKADVSKKDDVISLFNEGIAHFGKIDVLINNAGILNLKPLKDYSDEEFTQTLHINLKGIFNTLQEASEKLADNGIIINFSSSTVKMMLPGYAIYSATKAAVEQMTRVFSQEIGRGISVNAIAPGPTRTELFLKGKTDEFIDKLASMSPFERIAEPIDIANVVAFLASDTSKWISGQVIPVNGGIA